MYDVYISALQEGFKLGFVLGIVFYMSVWGLTVGIRLLKQIF